MKDKIKNLTKKEIGYIIGLFIGDGYSYNKKGRYKIEFYLNSVKDKDILKYINSLLTKLGLNYFVMKDKRHNSIKTFVNSKEFMFFINEEVESLKNRKLTKDYKIGLLSGFIDAEGWVRKGDIVLTQKDKNTLNFFRDISKQFKVEGKMWKNKGYKSKSDIWRLRVSTRFKYLLHNSLKVSRVYSGMEQKI